VASGKVKFASAWMTPEEKKVQAAQEALQSLKNQLADLQVQRAKLSATISTTQTKLTAAQGGTAASPGGGRRDLAGRLTAGITTPQQGEATTGQSGEIAAYQQQMSQEQGTLTSLDAKITDIQSQIPQREQDAKLALAQSKPGASSNAPAKDVHPGKPPPPPPEPEPTPPWYTRLWNYFHK
jgi:DNA repair exonuclease SbcCD ATPase subunit